MLGQYVARAVVSRGHALIETSHGECPITALGYVRRYAQMCDVVINCAGRTPKSGGTAQDMIKSNALGPHALAECTSKKRMVHVSTDCVFSGENGMNQPYTPEVRPDPKDLYGRTKLVGEVMMPHVLVIRTSFVGKEKGLLHWLLSQKPGVTIEGWERAIWNGTSVQIAADAIVNEATTGYRTGIHHMASAERVSKYWLLKELARMFDLNVHIAPISDPVIDRTLRPTMELPDLKWSLSRLIA